MGCTTATSMRNNESLEINPSHPFLEVDVNNIKLLSSCHT